MGIKKQVVITGTGRAGTTFLMELLTHLGLDTGFSSHEIEVHKDKVSNAGLEKNVGESPGAYIMKDPSFVDYAEELLVRDDICLEHVFVPMRDITAVSDSRRANQKAHFGRLSLREKLRYFRKPYLLYGGLLHTTSSKKGAQEEVLMKKLFDLLFSLSKYQVPVTFIQFPYLLSHPKYLYNKLEPVLKDVSYEVYLKTFETLSDPEKPRNFNLGK
ncbi:MAG: hypothetical protein HEP71_17120 [Roseivirga sp.]|nr:hypothetical protein [Roseivirga sp.]